MAELLTRIDPGQFPYLELLTDNFTVIQREVQDLYNDSKIKHTLLNLPGAKTSPKNFSPGWSVFAFSFHRHSPIDVIKKYPELNQKVVYQQYVETYQAVLGNHLKQLQKLLGDIDQQSQNGLITAFLSVLKPGSLIPKHHNADPYLYRVHLGISIPEGDLGISVNDDQLRWQEGGLLLFHPTDDHMAWNMSDKNRIVLILDFYRHDQPRDILVRMREEQYEHMMSQDPASFGMSGAIPAERS